MFLPLNNKIKWCPMVNFQRNNSPKQNLSPLSVGFLCSLWKYLFVWGNHKNVQVIPVSPSFFPSILSYRCSERVKCSPIVIVFKNNSKSIVCAWSHLSCDLSSAFHFPLLPLIQSQGFIHTHKAWCLKKTCLHPLLLTI